MNSLALLCRAIAKREFNSQRELSEELGISLGSVNALVRQAAEKGYISSTIGRHSSTQGRYSITEQGLEWLEQFKVDNAIILAAGFGSRLVPFTYDTPKGLLNVKGAPMIDHQIEQLLEVGVTEIIIVVGYLAEKFEYLIDKYGVRLVYNPEYATKNNYVSLYYAREYLCNSYILVADDWMEDNIFNTYEPDSWISCIYHEGETEDWRAVTGGHDLIVRMEFGASDDWVMVGPAFFTRSFSERYLPLLEDYYTRPGTKDYYWEHIIKENIGELPIHINRQSPGNVYEFESLEDLRAYDPSYLGDTDNEILSTIASIFKVPQSQIASIRPMSDGMTNLCFVFEVGGGSFVYRQPGLGTERLISRSNEMRTYELVRPLDVSDEVICLDGKSGVKITRYYNARVGDPFNDDEVKEMMGMLRKIHGANIQADYRFDIGERIGHYEDLANERDSILFEDYARVREWSRELLAFREALAVPERLCHIDYVYNNILFLPDGAIRVIDWEYSGMADPMIDVAMFSIYAYYTKEQMDKALRHYLGRKPERSEEARLYLYVALGGFAWSIWTEYKQGLGDDFGDYALEMYRYMKDYYRLLKDGGYLDGADSAAEGAGSVEVGSA